LGVEQLKERNSTVSLAEAGLFQRMKKTSILSDGNLIKKIDHIGGTTATV
jgi:hypothetical protein